MRLACPTLAIGSRIGEEMAQGAKRKALASDVRSRVTAFNIATLSATWRQSGWRLGNSSRDLLPEPEIQWKHRQTTAPFARRRCN